MWEGWREVSCDQTRSGGLHPLVVSSSSSSSSFPHLYSTDYIFTSLKSLGHTSHPLVVSSSIIWILSQWCEIWPGGLVQRRVKSWPSCVGHMRMLDTLNMVEWYGDQKWQTHTIIQPGKEKNWSGPVRSGPVWSCLVWSGLANQIGT